MIDLLTNNLSVLTGVKGSGITLISVDSISVQIGLAAPIEGAGGKENHFSYSLTKSYQGRGIVNILEDGENKRCFALSYYFSLHCKEEREKIRAKMVCNHHGRSKIPPLNFCNKCTLEERKKWDGVKSIPGTWMDYYNPAHFNKISFPVSLEDIPQLEYNNPEVLFHFFGGDIHQGMFKIHSTRKSDFHNDSTNKVKIIPLFLTFYTTNDMDVLGHFMPIENIHRFLRKRKKRPYRSDLSKGNEVSNSEACEFCLRTFTRKTGSVEVAQRDSSLPSVTDREDFSEAFLNHLESECDGWGRKIRFPDPNDKLLKFDKFHHLQEPSITLVADFECSFQSIDYLCSPCLILYEACFDSESKTDVGLTCKDLKHRSAPSKCKVCLKKFTDSVSTLSSKCKHKKGYYFLSPGDKLKGVKTFYKVCKTCSNELSDSFPCYHSKENKISRLDPIAFSIACIQNRSVGNGDARRILVKEIYRESDNVKELAQSFWQAIKDLYPVIDRLVQSKVPISPSEDQQREYDERKHCENCSVNFNEFNVTTRKTMDHDHITGEYRQTLCSKCNLQLVEARNNVSCFFHNFSGFDSHILVNNLPKDMKFDIVPVSSEKILSLTIIRERLEKDDDGNCNNQCNRIIFKDSMSFLQGSLERCTVDAVKTESERVKNARKICYDLCVEHHNIQQTPCKDCSINFDSIIDEKSPFSILKQSKIVCDSTGRFNVDLYNLCLQKGLFPYELINTLKKSDQVGDPPEQEAFFSQLGVGRGVTKEQYCDFLKA